MRHQLIGRGHVNAIHIGKAHGRRSAGQVNFFRASVTRHLHNLAAGGAAHNRIINQQHIATFELTGNHIELLAHRLFTHALPRHDESTAHIAIFDKAFTVRNAQQMRQLRGARPARFRDRNDDINLIGRHSGHDTLGQRFTQIQARLVDRNTVEYRVRPG